jgi:hypothetical protein
LAKTRLAARSGAGGNLIGTREPGFWSILIVAVAFWANVVQATSPGDMQGVNSIMARILDNEAFIRRSVWAGLRFAWGCAPAGRRATSSSSCSHAPVRNWRT